MANLQIRIEDDLKQQAGSVLEQMGLDMTSAVRMYLKEIVRINGLGSVRNFVSVGVSGGMVKSHPFVFSDTGFTVTASRARPLHALLDA